MTVVWDFPIGNSADGVVGGLSDPLSPGCKSWMTLLYFLDVVFISITIV